MINQLIGRSAAGQSTVYCITNDEMIKWKFSICANRGMTVYFRVSKFRIDSFAGSFIRLRGRLSCTLIFSQCASINKQIMLGFFPTWISFWNFVEKRRHRFENLTPFRFEINYDSSTFLKTSPVLSIENK